MKLNMTVSPDFSPDHIAGWYIFNTWLQKQTNLNIHLELYNSFEEQRKDIKSDMVDIIYANPYDASLLIREKGFISIASPLNESDEAVICVNSDSNVDCIDDLQPNSRIAATKDPEIFTIGMIMLEPVELSANNTAVDEYENYVMVAKNLINKNADVGIFLKEAYDNMSKFVKNQIKPIITSQISVIRHSLLVSPKLFEAGGISEDDFKSLIEQMHKNEKGLDTLNALGFKQWELQSQEDSEFMIDLMDTLVS